MTRRNETGRKSKTGIFFKKIGVYSEIKCFVNYVIPDSGLFEENSESFPTSAYGAFLNKL